RHRRAGGGCGHNQGAGAVAADAGTTAAADRRSVQVGVVWITGSAGRGSMRHTGAVGIFDLTVLCVGCKAEAEKPAVSSPPAVQVGSENVVTVQKGTVVVGPIVSGELKPEREAT